MPVFIQEVDHSSLIPNESVSGLAFSSKRGPTKHVEVGAFPRAKYYGMSHRRKVAFNHYFRQGDFGLQHFLKVFGTPNFSNHSAFSSLYFERDYMQVVRVDGSPL